jgi:hypothetical protein
MRGAHLHQLMLLVLSLALAVPALAQAPSESPLSNADVAKMLKAGIPESIILRKIQTSETDFHTGAGALIELKKQGASENILGAVLDSQAIRSNYASGASAGPNILGHTAPPRTYRLPSFEADVRLNSNKREKITVGKNHIKVEQSGVPVFNLKWKENSPQE